MLDRKEVWEKYIGDLNEESLCYVGCGTVIDYSTFINHSGKPVCNICSGYLLYTGLDEFKKHYKLVTPECYNDVNQKVTGDVLLKNVLKEGAISVFSSKYGYKYAINLLLNLSSLNPGIKICATPSKISYYKNKPDNLYNDIKIWSYYHNKVVTGLDKFPGFTNLITNHNSSRMQPSYGNNYVYDIVIYHFQTASDLDHIIKEKLEYEAVIGKKISLIVTYDNDYDIEVKTRFLNLATHFVSVGIEDNKIVAIINKLNNKSCDKTLKYNYVKLFGGQKVIGLEII